MCLAIVLERQQSFLFPIHFSALERVPESGRGLNPFVLESQPDFVSCPAHAPYLLALVLCKTATKTVSWRVRPTLVLPTLLICLFLCSKNENQGCGLASHLAIYLPTCLSTCLPVCYLQSAQSDVHASVKGLGDDSTTSTPQFCLFHPDTGKH